RVTKLDARNDDRIELVRDLGRASDVSLESLSERADRLSVLANGFFPALLHLPELTRSRLIVGLLVVMILGVVDLFLAAPRCHVVGIECQDLLIFLKGQVIAAGGVISVGI